MTACKTFAGVFALLWVAALGLFLIGSFGLFGQERDPLSGVFVILLGMPWIKFVPEIRYSGALAALTPGLNLLVILALCRWRGRRS